MNFLIDLWLPIVLSAVFIFIASSIIHMVIKSHSRDYAKLPDEDQLLAVMRTHNVQPGHYMFPYCTDMKGMDSEAMQNTQSSIRETADVLNRSPSTISRELRRNKGQRGYCPGQAQALADERARETRTRTTITEHDWADIAALVRRDWSPEQISGRMRREHWHFISPEWIYQYFWMFIPFLQGSVAIPRVSGRYPRSMDRSNAPRRTIEARFHWPRSRTVGSQTRDFTLILDLPP